LAKAQALFCRDGASIAHRSSVTATPFLQPCLRSLHFPYGEATIPALIAYRLRREKSRVEFVKSAHAMADVIYIVLALAFLALMSVYALACDRL
jgi:hypothetical protein